MVAAGDTLFLAWDDVGRDVGFLDSPGGVSHAVADVTNDAWRAEDEDDKDGCDADLVGLPTDICTSGTYLST